MQDQLTQDSSKQSASNLPAKMLPSCRRDQQPMATSARGKRRRRRCRHVASKYGQGKGLRLIVIELISTQILVSLLIYCHLVLAGSSQLISRTQNQSPLISDYNRPPAAGSYYSSATTGPGQQLYQLAHNHYSQGYFSAPPPQSQAAESSPLNQYQDSSQPAEAQDDLTSGSGGESTSNFAYEDQLVGSQSNQRDQQPNNQDSGYQDQGADQLTGNDEAAGQQQQAPVPTARERCRELISLTLLSFRDLSPNERASEEIDCANLREQIAAAAGRTNTLASSTVAAPAPLSAAAKHKQQKISTQPTHAASDSDSLPPTQQPTEEFPLAPQLNGAGGSFSGANQQQVSSHRLTTVIANRQQQQQPAFVSVNDNAKAALSLAPSSSSSSAGVSTLSVAAELSQQQQQQQQQQRQQQLLQPSPAVSPSSWQPKNSYISQVQQLLLQQQQNQRQRQQEQQKDMLQLYNKLTSNNNRQPAAASIVGSSSPAAARPSTTTTTTTTTTSTTTPPPTTLATTFESMLETTTFAPPTTTTTTTTTTQRPKIRVGAPPGGKRRANGKALRTTSTTTTTTTTTTPQPSAQPDYADGSEVSTDYYDEYDDQQSQQDATTTTTTTTTTTSRPHRHRGGGNSNHRKNKRRFTTSTTTTPKPSTTTLSPGYQPRPDGRIIDYMADPNFPRELKGADLTNYPFYISVPEKIDFECKGRHDGYYTNIQLHCQIYHHCALGNRYDFLCPNYTLFDQTTFTCRFINTVDCDGSAKHFDRNNALYIEKDNYKDENSNNNAQHQLTSSTSTSTTTQAPKLSIQMNHRRGDLSVRPNEKAQVSALALINHQLVETSNSSSSSIR